MWNNFPAKAADSAITVHNPEDVWTNASSNLEALPSQIDATFTDLLFGSWGGAALGTVQVYALAVSMASQAILAMEQVKSIGKTQKEEEKNRLIGWIVTAVLMIVPFVGEPGSAPFLILGWLIGAGGVARLDRNADSFSKMVAARGRVRGAKPRSWALSLMTRRLRSRRSSEAIPNSVQTVIACHEETLLV
jgi:hypothetical protein